MIGIEKGKLMHPVIGIVIAVGPSAGHIISFIEEYIRSTLCYRGKTKTILVCNNSDDLCYETLKKYETDDLQVYDIGICEHGISKARNYGLKKMPDCVHYISFIDDDDAIVGPIFEKINKYVIIEADIICFGWNVCKAQENKNIYRGLPRTGLVHKDTIIKDDLAMYLRLPREMPYLGYVWGKFFKAELIKSNKLKFNEEISTFEDVLFLVQSIFVAKKIQFFDFAIINHDWIKKTPNNKASFAAHNIKRAMGFINVARFIEKNISRNKMNGLVDKEKLLARYCGYMFYFNLLRVAKHINLVRLCSVVFIARRIMTGLNREFNQSRYRVFPETGESTLLGYLHFFKAWTLAIIYCVLRARMVK